MDGIRAGSRGGGHRPAQGRGGWRGRGARVAALAVLLAAPAAPAAWGQAVQEVPPPPVTAPALETAPDRLQFFSIGSGEVTGSYFAVADAICEVINRIERRRLRCSPEATQGSLYNLAALRDGQLEFALVQSDWQRYAYEGKLAFATGGPMTGLRSVMGLYPESLTILARRGLGLTSLSDLRGRWVDIGPPASGRHATAVAALGAAGIGRGAVAGMLELPIASAYDELCAGRIDASLLILGHPNQRLGEVMARCGLEILPFGDGLADRFVNDSPDYRPARIAAGTYPGLAEDVSTIAVTATIVTRADVAPEMVAKLVADTLDQLSMLQITQPILSGLDGAVMASEGLTAPLHPAAARAFAARPGP